MSKEAMTLAQDLRTLADRFSEGWHDGIKIDASDIMLLTDAAQALEEQPAQQEPVAWMCHPFGDDEVEYGPHQECENCIPLYTSPQPSKPWVGLTKKEVHDLYDSDHAVFHQRIEAKLREKNT